MKQVQPIPPCGSCRQSIAEYEINKTAQLKFILWGKIGSIYNQIL
jgi:cytidine deaminase